MQRSFRGPCALSSCLPGCGSPIQHHIMHLSYPSKRAPLPVCLKSRSQKDWSLFVLALTSVLHASHLQGLLCHISLHLLTSILHVSDAFNFEVEAPS